MIRRYAVPVLVSIACVMSLVCGCGGGAGDPPLPPASVTASIENPKALSITWDDVADATSYVLYYSPSPGTALDVVRVEGVTSPYLLSGLAQNTEYSLSLTAVNNNGEGDPSALVTATPRFQGILETTYPEISASGWQVTKMASDGDGNIFVLLSSLLNGISTIYKYNNAGELDTGFGSNGTIVHTYGGEIVGGDAVMGIDTDGNGALYATGFYQTGVKLVMRTWKYTNDGVIDTSFGGGNGYVDGTNVSANVIYGMDLDAASEDNILVFGLDSTEGSNTRIYLWRYDHAGNLLSSFEQGFEPYHLIVFGGYVRADSTGSIYVMMKDARDQPPMLWKILSTGDGLDTSFNPGGETPGMYSFDGYKAGLNGVTGYAPSFDADDNIYVIAVVQSGNFGTLYNIKLDQNGALVQTFGAAGVADIAAVCTDDSDTMAPITSLYSGGDDIIAAGANLASGSINEMLCALDGGATALDASVFTSGIYAGTSGMLATHLSEDPFGRILVLGVLNVDSPTGYRVLRFK